MRIYLNPNNPRFIKDEKFKKLVNSIKDFPKMLELRPIIVNPDGMILGGNMRYRAIQELGWEIKPEWVKTAESLTAEEQRRFIVEDNVGFGDWDWDELSTEYEKEELEEWGLDVDKWKEDEVVEDEVPEVTENPVSKLGEVYQLGRHRIMCGDSTKIEDVEKLMDGKKADMVFTDPPYGQSFEIKGDTKGEYRGIYDGALESIMLFAKDNYYICCNYACIGYFAYKAEEMGLKIYDKVVWYKNLFGQGTLYHRQHEDIIFCGNGNYLKDKRNDDVDVWQINSMRNFGGNETAKEDVVHPTQKPIELVSRAIKNSSKIDDVVLDLFLGSGSTLIACEQTNRICYGMEIDPKYCDVIRKRYCKFINGSEDGWEKATPQV